MNSEKRIIVPDGIRVMFVDLIGTLVDAPWVEELEDLRASLSYVPIDGALEFLERAAKRFGSNCSLIFTYEDQIDTARAYGETLGRPKIFRPGDWQCDVRKSDWKLFLKTAETAALRFGKSTTLEEIVYIDDDPIAAYHALCAGFGQVIYLRTGMQEFLRLLARLNQCTLLDKAELKRRTASRLSVVSSVAAIDFFMNEQTK
jgi:hypothetical protein